MRCFIAVELPDELRPIIAKLQKELLPYANAKLVEPENLHLTLKFLGEIDESTAAKVKAQISKAVSGLRAFDVHVSGIGIFPDMKFIRVVWIGCKSNELIKLQKAIDSSLTDFFRPERDFNLHLTVARVKSVKNKQDLADFIEKNKGLEIGKLTANKIKLKQSTLTPNGPVYKDVEVYNLV